MAHSVGICDNEPYLDKLRTAMALVEALRHEKEVYKENFDRLREAHNELISRAEEVTRERDGILGQNISLEHENETLSKKLRESDVTIRDLDELRRQLVEPKDIELMRLKLAKENNEEHELKWQTLREETDKYRNEYFELRTHHEMLLSEHEHSKQKHESILEEMKMIHHQEIQVLENQVETLKSNLLSMSEAEKVRQLQRDNNELSSKCQHFARELEELRTQKEAIDLHQDQQDRLNARKSLEESSLSKTIASEKEALVAKLKSVEEELHSVARAHDKVVEENRQLQKDLTTLRSRHEETIHKFNVETSDLKTEIVKEKSSFDQALKEARQQHNETKNILKAANETITELRFKLSNVEKDVSEKIRMLREEEWSRYEQLENEKKEVERSLEHLRQRKHEAETLVETQRKEYTMEISQLRKELSELTAKYDNSTVLNHSMEAEIERLRSTMATLQNKVNEYESKLVDMSGQVEKYKRDELGFKEQISSFDANVHTLQTELGNLTHALHKERETYIANLERLKTSALKEQGQLQNVIKGLEEDNSDLIRQCDSLKAESDDFKKKAKSLKEKIKDYKLLVENSRLEMSTLKKQWEVEKMKTEADKKDTIKRQEEFMTLLQSELLANN